YLYAAMASIRYYEKKLTAAERQEAAPYFHYATRWSLCQAEKALLDFLDNFPSSATRKFMRLITVTYSAKMPKINDNLVRELAEQAQLNTEFKKNLTHLIKPIAGDGNDINEQAYLAKMECLPLLAKVKKALRARTFKAGVKFSLTLDAALGAKVISSDEHKLLQDYNLKRERAIRVDEFDFDMNLISDRADLKIAN
ncbi:acyl-CoA dehydrogenase domain-containing protein, partial [Shewanella sp. 0m-11]